jgi:hypothetical protein
MALNHDEVALRDALDDLARDQPQPPAGRYAAVRRRVVRHRLRRAAAGAGVLAVAVAAVVTAVALPVSGTRPEAARPRPVPGWALPWSDHRNGSVPQRVLDGAVAAWRHFISMQTGRAVQPGRVIWYVGQTVPAVGEVVVIFEADSPDGHQLVMATALTSEVMNGQQAWSGVLSPWELNEVPAPSPPRAGLWVGLNLMGVGTSRGPSNDIWSVILAGPRVRRVSLTAPSATGHRVSALTARGLAIVDTGQNLASGWLTGLFTDQGNVLRRAEPMDQAVTPVNGTAPLDLPTSFHLNTTLAGPGSGSITGLPVLKPGQRAAVFAICNGPDSLQIRLDQHQIGVIQCDNRQRELVVPSGHRLARPVVLDVRTSDRTAWRVDYGILP